MFLSVADLVTDHSCASHDSVATESAMIHIHLLTVTAQVVELVDIDATARVRDDIEEPGALLAVAPRHLPCMRAMKAP